MKLKILSLTTLICISPLASAAIIGFDDFSYTNGSINGRTGGTNWNAVGGTSDWGTSGSAIVGGQLETSNNVGAFREYGGNENASGISTGQVFFRVTATTNSGTIPNYFGISSFTNGSERAYFGRLYAGNFGVERSGAGSANSATAVSPAANTVYTFVGVQDFTNQKLTFFLNPTGSDFYLPSGVTSSTTSVPYTSGFGSTQIRLQAGDQGPIPPSVLWDNITVGTSPSDVGLSAVPEPSALMLGLLGLIGVCRRKR